MRDREKLLEVLQGPVAWMNRFVIRNVVAVIPQRRRKEGHQPDCVDAKLLQIVQAQGETSEISDPVVIGIRKGAHMHLINDCMLVPACFDLQWQPVPPDAPLNSKG